MPTKTIAIRRSFRVCCALLAATFLSVGALRVRGEDDAGAKRQDSEVAENPFASGKLWKVHLEISAEEYAAMEPRGRRGRGFFGFGPPQAEDREEQPADPDREFHTNTFGVDLPWATGSVTIDDMAFAKIGLRYKGNGTIMDASRSIKKSFKIDLHRLGGEERFRGLKKINLHCGAADPSKCRETLGYSLYRAAGVPASRTALAEVTLTVPGKYDAELLGLYTVVEQVGGQFLRAHYGTDKGLLMKPEGFRDFDDWGDDWQSYAEKLDPEREATADEAQRVIAFAQLIHQADDETFRREVESYLDVDAYLRFLAATAFLANSDSFFVLGHNYYLYLHPETGQFHFIPWDLDRAFANFPILGSNDQQMELSFKHPYAGAHRLTERLLDIPQVSENYQKLLVELSRECFDKDRLLSEVHSVQEATKELKSRGEQAADARQEGRGGGFGPPGMFGGGPPDLELFVVKRTESVAAQLAGTSQGHVPQGGFGPGGFGFGPRGRRGRPGPQGPGGPGRDREGRPGFGGGPFEVGDMMARPLMEALDADEDRQLAKEEWLAAASKVWAACKLDEKREADEGAITAALEDLFPNPPAGAPGGPEFSPAGFMAGPIVKRADADNNDKVSEAELTAAAGELFDEFDDQATQTVSETTFAKMLTALFAREGFGPPRDRLPQAK